MSELLKMATMVAVLGISMYVKSQEHEYKIQTLEKIVSTHLDKHENQYDAIQKSLVDLKIQLLGLSEKPGTKQSHYKGGSYEQSKE